MKLNERNNLIVEYRQMIREIQGMNRQINQRYQRMHDIRKIMLDARKEEQNAS